MIAFLQTDGAFNSWSVILVRTTAGIPRGLIHVALGDSSAVLAVDPGEAFWHVNPAADGLESVDGIVPVRKGVGGGCRCCGWGTAGVSLGFAGVDVRGEGGVVVMASHIAGRKDNFRHLDAEGVAFRSCALVEKREGRV